MKKVSAVVLLRHDGAALFNHRDDKPGLPDAGKWTFIGGHRDDGESAVDCARREFVEETGCILGDIYYLRTAIVSRQMPPCELTVFYSMYDGSPISCYEGQENAFILRADAGGYDIPAFLFELWDEAIAKMGD